MLGILVFVHELGHYGMGRLLGFKIVEFAIGMGPKLAKFERKGILYSIRALPIGGMCNSRERTKALRTPIPSIQSRYGSVCWSCWQAR